MTENIRDRLERWVNPMLVRQMYQSLHNRTFLASMWILVLAALVTYVVVFAGREAGSPAGGTMFLVFGGLFYLVAMLVFPYLAFTSLRREIKTGTIELIEITPMNASRRIRGRLLAVFTRLVLLYSVIGPFAMTAYLLGGVALWEIVLSLYTLLVASCVIVSLALFFASLASIKFIGSVGRGVFFFVLVALFITGAPRVFDGSGLMLMELDGEGWRAILAYFIVLTLEGGLFVWFLCAASANVLTFQANKSSGRTKFIMLLLLISGLVAFGVTWLLADGDAHLLGRIERFACVLLGGSAIFWMTGEGRLRAHTAEKLEDRSGWYRAVFYPFTDGAGSTAIYLFLALLLLETGITMCCALGGLSLRRQTGHFYALSVLVYAPYFSSCAWVVGRCVPAKHRNAAVRRLIVVGFILGHLFCAALWSGMNLHRYGSGAQYLENPLLGLFPFAFISTVKHSGALSGRLIQGLSLAIVVGLVPHLYIAIRNMIRLCTLTDLNSQYPGSR